MPVVQLVDTIKQRKEELGFTIELQEKRLVRF